MTKKTFTITILLAGMCLSGAPANAQSLNPHQQLARDIFRELIDIKSTESGVGSTPAAEAISRRFLAAGFAPADVQVVGPIARKMNVVTRLHGKGLGKPILLLAHLDVVEANREDWSKDIDPFKFVERDGYYYGRGTQDIKNAAAILAANFIRWRQEGWVPERDLILALTADEESGDNNGVAWLLKNQRELIDAEYCLNTDSGDFQSRDGKPQKASVSAGEKKFSTLELTANNRGGHSSLPRPDNAIYELAAALERVAKFQFPVRMTELTRAQFAAMASGETGQVQADMKAVAAGEGDSAASARLSQNPYYNALMRTTCVATMLSGGHAENALPQKATAVVNCRILPGHPSADVMRDITQAVADPQIDIKWRNLDPTEDPAPRLRPDILGVIGKTATALWPGITMMPSMDTGGSDGRYLRGAGIPVYGVAGVFIDEDDVRAHGRDERLRVKAFFDGLEFYDRLVRTLAGQ